MKLFQRLAILAASVFLTSYAQCWCYLLPDSITYGSSTDGLSGGTAKSMSKDPSLEDLSDGNIITANIISVDAFDVYFYYYDPSLAVPPPNSVPPVKVTVNQVKHTDASGNIYTERVNQGIGLAKNQKAYYLVNIGRPPEIPYLKNDATDYWVQGNWIFEFPEMIKELVDGNWGGRLRVTAADAVHLPGVPLAVRIKNVVRFGETFATTQDVPSGAAEAPFSTSSMKKLPIVIDCQITDDCPVPPVVDNKKPITVKWSINRNI